MSSAARALRSSLFSHEEAFTIDAALRECAWSGRTRAVSTLLAFGADPSARNCAGRCSLHLAALSGHADACVLLARSKPACLGICDRNGSTPLHLAAFSGNYATVEELVQLGADPGALDRFGRRPADLCGSEAAKILLLSCRSPEDLLDCSSRSVRLLPPSGASH